MNPTLYLLIDDDWPQQTQSALWWLTDTTGKITRQGWGSARTWLELCQAEPQPDCCLLLHGHQLNCHTLPLPLPATRLSQSVLASALEDHLLAPADTLLFTAFPGTRRGPAQSVASYPRPRLCALLERLQAIGICPRAAWPLSFLLDAGEAALTRSTLEIHLPAQHNAASSHRSIPLTLALPDPLYRAQLNEFLPESERPQRIYRCLPPADAEMGVLPDVAILPSLPLQEKAWRLPSGAGFLLGELAPPSRRRAWLNQLRHWRRAALIGTLTLAMLFIGQTLWLSYERSQLREQISADFRTIDAQGPMVDPIRQARRQLDQVHQENGLLSPGDFLALMQALPPPRSAHLPIRQLSYAPGRLEVETSLTPEQREQIEELARPRQIAVQFTPTRVILSSEP